jgi:hypothetical protein
MSKTAVCFLTIRPDSIMLDFLSRFNEYVVFIVVDDLISDYQNLYPNVQLIKVYFNETLLNFIESENKKVSFIHIDADLYSSTKYIFDTVLK